MKTVKELSQKYNADVSGLYKKIKRNREKLSYHMQIINGVIQVDDLAAEFLIPKKQMIKEKLETQIRDSTNKYESKINYYKDKLNELEAEKEAVEKKYTDALLRIEELEQQLFLSENKSNKKVFLPKIFK